MNILIVSILFTLFVTENTMNFKCDIKEKNDYVIAELILTCVYLLIGLLFQMLKKQILFSYTIFMEIVYIIHLILFLINFNNILKICEITKFMYVALVLFLLNIMAMTFYFFILLYLKLKTTNKNSYIVIPNNKNPAGV